MKKIILSVLAITAVVYGSSITGGGSGGITSPVSILNGGTGQTTATAGFTALAPSQASANGQFLTSNGTNASWAAVTPSYPLLASAGTVSAPSYAFTGGAGFGNKGMYSGGSNVLSIANAGADKISMDATGGLTFTSTQSSGTVYSFDATGSSSSAAAGALFNFGNLTGTNAGMIWSIGNAPNGSTQFIGMRESMTASGAMNGYAYGTYIASAAANSANSLLSQYQGAAGNIALWGYANPNNNTGQAIGVGANGFGGKYNAGGVFQGFDPKDVAGNVVYGSRSIATRLSGAMSNPSQIVGVYGIVAESDTTAFEQRDPGMSSAAVFDNTATTASIITGMDNGVTVFQVQDGGSTTMQAYAGTPITVDLTADNQSVSGSYSTIRLTSDNATSTNRTFVLADGIVDGQRLVLEWNEDNTTGSGELLDSGNQNLSATWTPNIGDTLQLVWNSGASEWRELSRSNN